MKKLLVATLLICSFNLVKAQTDYCKDIKKTDDKAKDVIRYESPGILISIQKTFVKGYEGANPIMIFMTSKKTADYNAGGLYVTFADGTMWKDEGAHLDCSYTSAEYGYSYVGGSSFPPRKLSQIEPFKTKKITKIQMSDMEMAVTDEEATKFMAYVNCILAITKPD